MDATCCSHCWTVGQSCSHAADLDPPPVTPRDQALLGLSQTLADLLPLALRLPDLSDETTPEANSSCEPTFGVVEEWVSGDVRTLSGPAQRTTTS